MTNETILKKAIEKAEKGGYKMPLNIDSHIDVFGIIFSHDFAKAFWGEESVCEYCLRPININRDEICERHSDYEIERWRAGLQNMVLEKEPLLYLKKFL